MALTLADLIANRTLGPDMAALLAAAIEERRSLLVVAIPRNAGKTTLMTAVLEERPDGVPLYMLGTRHGESLGIPEPDAPAGYLTMSEIAPHPVTDSYLWGADVRRVFGAAHTQGQAIATALHADGIDSAFNVIAQNGVPNEQASLIDVVVYIRLFGQWQDPERRVVETIHEVERIQRGQVVARLTHSWNEATDQFETVTAPSSVSPQAYAHHLARFTEAAPPDARRS
ncbi:MAG: hypothetical protein OXG95_11745 [Chloroflexi bacterium]|nr:hypothetical protein [Chloroflexota bacterium]